MGSGDVAVGVARRLTPCIGTAPRQGSGFGLYLLGTCEMHVYLFEARPQNFTTRRG